MTQPIVDHVFCTWKMEILSKELFEFDQLSHRIPIEFHRNVSIRPVSTFCQADFHRKIKRISMEISIQNRLTGSNERMPLVTTNVDHDNHFPQIGICSRWRRTAEYSTSREVRLVTQNVSNSLMNTAFATYPEISD
jgi:hypothetical protein